jgi:hypothetical protein
LSVSDVVAPGLCSAEFQQPDKPRLDGLGAARCESCPQHARALARREGEREGERGRERERERDNPGGKRASICGAGDAHGGVRAGIARIAGMLV